MQCHGPTSLRGPITRSRDRWRRFIDLDRRDDTAVAELDECPPSRSDRDVRWDLVERIRQEIADGTYETPEKWETALDRLLKRLEEK